MITKLTDLISLVQHNICFQSIFVNKMATAEHYHIQFGISSCELNIDQARCVMYRWENSGNFFQLGGCNRTRNIYFANFKGISIENPKTN